MYFLIIALGFMLAMRGTRPAPLERPGEGLARVWREAMDLFLTVGFMLALGAVAVAWETSRGVAGEYTLLGFGAVAYLLSRYQKKTDAFFLASTVIAFAIQSKQGDLLLRLSLAWAVSVGIGVFQTGFLGLRYRLLFSKVPVAVKGWPGLCLLAGFLSVILWSAGRVIF